MPYTTEAIVRAESPFKDSALIDSTYVDRAIAQADDLIDSIIGSVYSLPLSTTPSIIQDVSTTLAIINLLRDQNLNIEIANGVDMESKAEDAMNTLEMIRTRKIKLYSSGSELATSDLIKPAYYPTTASTSSGDTEAKFTMNKVF